MYAQNIYAIRNVYIVSLDSSIYKYVLYITIYKLGKGNFCIFYGT
jgi:hypothetical protein